MLPFARYRVEGESMTPAVTRGSRVLVSRASYWFSDPRPGDVVVVRDPRERERLLLKRIESGPAGEGYRVLGDNPDARTDSRVFGAVPRDLILGKVLLQY